MYMYIRVGMFAADDNKTRSEIYPVQPPGRLPFENGYCVQYMYRFMFTDVKI